MSGGYASRQNSSGYLYMLKNAFNIRTYEKVEELGIIKVELTMKIKF